MSSSSSNSSDHGESSSRNNNKGAALEEADILAAGAEIIHEGAINQCNTASDRPENTSGSDIEASAPASHGLAFTPEQHQALLALLQGSSHLQSHTINQLTSQPNNLASATLKSNRKKLDSRSRKCINLGHKPGVKGHLLFDLHNKELFISRDVVFFESHFPYKHNPSMPSSAAHTTTHLDDLFDDVFLPNPVPNPTFNHSVDNGHTENNSHSADFNSNETNHPTHSPTNETNHLHSGNCEPIPVRRSHRQIHPPNYLKDYHCNLLHHPDSAVASSSSTCKYPISSAISYDSFSSPHKHYMLNLSANPEPTSYEHAICDENWRTAINTELQALVKTKTWDLMPLPSNKKAIGCSRNKPKEGRTQDPIMKGHAYVNNELLLQPNHEYIVLKKFQF
ncbi:hypothetical protein KIW84_012447 [Lathyrus oleraceus]|uniref:Retroviral polymerase SH3-like domain-containing protein n=1 Tax=Pisum sativum TaxID=3888 RepID=A0A9D5BHS5_PEA|nr:hypothetical protein KIW84_012447 [Pisum sativum]